MGRKNGALSGEDTRKLSDLGKGEGPTISRRWFARQESCRAKRIAPWMLVGRMGANWSSKLELNQSAGQSLDAAHCFYTPERRSSIRDQWLSSVDTTAVDDTRMLWCQYSNAHKPTVYRSFFPLQVVNELFLDPLFTWFGAPYHLSVKMTNLQCS